MEPSILKIRLDDERAVFRPGETISGAVVVEPGARASCRRLVIVAEWSTNGAQDGGRAAHRVLARGAACAGEHRFELIAPLGPLSYLGDVLSVGWQLAARAELDSGIAQSERSFSLVGWQPGEWLPASGGYRAGRRKPPETYVFGTRPADAPRDWSLARPIDSAVPFAGLANAVGRGLSRLWGRSRIGEPEISVPSEVAAGEALSVRLRGHHDLTRMVVRLVGRELALYPPRSRARYATHRSALAYFDEADATFDGDAWCARLPLAATTPPTFSGKHNALGYELEIECRGRGARLDLRRPLIVRPPRVALAS